MKPHGILLRLLYELEIAGLRLDYANFRRQFQSDRWFIQNQGRLRELLSFTEVARVLLHTGSPIQIAHESTAKSKAPVWYRLSYIPIWSRHWPAFFWTSGMSLCALFVTYVVAEALTPDFATPFLKDFFWAAVVIVASRPCHPSIHRWFVAWRRRAALKREEQRKKAKLRAALKREEQRKKAKLLEQQVSHPFVGAYAPPPRATLGATTRTGLSTNVQNAYMAASVYQRYKLQQEIQELNDNIQESSYSGGDF